MLGIKDNRSVLSTKESVILSPKKMKDLVNETSFKLNCKATNSMDMMINCNIEDSLKMTINLSESVFKFSHFVETFEEEFIKIANFNIFYKTIEFAKVFFKNKKRNYTLEVTEGEKTILKIFRKEIQVLKIEFSSFMPIEFYFLNNNFSYEELFEYYKNKISVCEPSERKAIQHKLESIIEFGEEGLKDIENFLEEYIKNFSIDLKQTTSSWYKIKIHDIDF